MPYRENAKVLANRCPHCGVNLNYGKGHFSFCKKNLTLEELLYSEKVENKRLKAELARLKHNLRVMQNRINGGVREINAGFANMLATVDE